MNYSIDLTNSIVVDLTIEKGKTLNKTIQCLVESGDTYGLFSFAPYTAATLTVKKRPNDFNVPMKFSTSDSSIVLATGQFTLSKTEVETEQKTGQYFYEMSLIGSGGTFGFLRGKFFIIDESYGEVSCEQMESIYLKPQGVVFTGVTVNSGNVVAGINVSSTYYATVDSDFIGVSASTPTIIYLPNSPRPFQRIVVADIKGNAFGSPIIIDGNSNLIAGYTFAEINTDFGAIAFINNTAGWSVTGFAG